MPSEAAELLPCGRIEDRPHSPKGRYPCDSYLPEQRLGQTRGQAPKRDEPALSPRPPLHGPSGKTVAWLGDKNHMRGGSPVAPPSPFQFLFEEILSEWLRDSRPDIRL